jgi:hypothetical protein
MDKLNGHIEDAIGRISTLTEIARWLWCINLVVLVAGLFTCHFELAALAGFTWVLALVGAAIGRRAIDYLNNAEQTIRSVQLG